jgi:dipeptidase
MKNCKRLSGIFALFFVPFFLFSTGRGDDGGFTVVAGKQAGGSETVFIAHNQDAAGSNILVNVHKIPAAAHQKTDVIKINSATAISQTAQTAGYLWLQVPAKESADSFFNENGVTITTNICQSRENQPQLTGGGIGFMLPHIMIQRAISAKDAVRIAGELIETYGYYNSGLCISIADPKEAWTLQVVKGKHWIAHRIPDDHAAVITNCYTIGKINLLDKQNFAGSNNIIQYAVKRGWYNPQKDGPFHFAKAYAAMGTIEDRANILRLWRSLNLLSKKKYKIDEPLPSIFPVQKEIGLIECFRILRDHYEDTEYDLTTDLKKGSPHTSRYPAICTGNTSYSFVAELRGSDIQKEIANRIWIAFSQPDNNAYCPWYTSITTPPEGYNPGNSDTALITHFNQMEKSLKSSPNLAYRCFAKLSEMVNVDYKNRIKPVKKEWKNLESYAIKRLKKMEKEFTYLLEVDRHIARKIITNDVHRLEYRKWFLAMELLKKLEKMD